MHWSEQDIEVDSSRQVWIRFKFLSFIIIPSLCNLYCVIATELPSRPLWPSNAWTRKCLKILSSYPETTAMNRDAEASQDDDSTMLTLLYMVQSMLKLERLNDLIVAVAPLERWLRAWCLRKLQDFQMNFQCGLWLSFLLGPSCHAESSVDRCTHLRLLTVCQKKWFAITRDSTRNMSKTNTYTTIPYSYLHIIG